MTFTGDYSTPIKKIKQALQNADAILIGAGAGLSAAAGLTYTGSRFESTFSDFRKKYGITDMYSGGFYPYDTLEEYWAWWSRHILINRYDSAPGRPYLDLLALVQGQDYFVLTTNVDHQFQRCGFDKKRLFYTQGDYGLWQCFKPCHAKTYENEEAVRRMVSAQKDMKIPSDLIPYCPVCGAPMSMNLRCDNSFVQDSGWYAAAKRYEDFISRHASKKLLLLELGVGSNTPSIIKYNFWQQAAENPNAVYACINLGEAFAPPEIADRSVCVDMDLQSFLCRILKPES